MIGYEECQHSLSFGFGSSACSSSEIGEHMKRILQPYFWFSLVIVAFNGLASSQTAVPCEKYKDPNYIYIGPDHQILFTGGFGANAYAPPESAVPYLKRMASILRSRGIVPIISLIPASGIFYLGKLDPVLIKGTVFEKISAPSKAAVLRDSYIKSIRYLESLGFEVPNILDEMLSFTKANPGASVFLKRDNHWSVNGTRSVAKAISSHIGSKFPELYKSIHQNDFTLVKSGIAKLPVGFGYDPLIKRSCPEHVPFEETWDTFELVKTNPSEVSAQQLFGSEVQDVVLLGTSFSTATGKMGFQDFLSAELGTKVVNYAIAGGGPLGAFLEYFMSIDGSSELPKSIIWEMPGSQITTVDESNGQVQMSLTAASFRQVLPIMVDRATNGNPIKTKLLKTTEVQAGFQADTNCINLKFSDLSTRKVKLTLRYALKTEEIELRHPRSKFLNTYYVELLQGVGKLESIQVEAEGQAVGDVEITPYVYKN
jgi:SGNH hydrolase-like domain, acetyltransferase AlgX